MTARQVEIHPDALAEAEAAIEWYAERSLRAPVAFMEELDKAIESILHAPNVGRSLTRTADGSLYFVFLISLFITKSQQT
jgi:plasmid stabilization system protein ParE